LKQLVKFLFGMRGLLLCVLICAEVINAANAAISASAASDLGKNLANAYSDHGSGAGEVSDPMGRGNRNYSVFLIPHSHCDAGTVFWPESLWLSPLTGCSIFKKLFTTCLRELRLKSFFAKISAFVRTSFFSLCNLFDLYGSIDLSMSLPFAQAG